MSRRADYRTLRQTNTYGARSVRPTRNPVVELRSLALASIRSADVTEGALDCQEPPRRTLPSAKGNLEQEVTQLGRVLINPARVRKVSFALNNGAKADIPERPVWTAPSWQGFSSRLQAGQCSHVFGLFVRFT